MHRVRVGNICAIAALSQVLWLVGCRIATHDLTSAPPEIVADHLATADEEDRSPRSKIRPASLEERDESGDSPSALSSPRKYDDSPLVRLGKPNTELPTEEFAQPANDDQIFNGPELELVTLVDEVLARNPSLQAAVAGWQAAVQKYPQAISLDDPMLQSMLGPGSWDSDMVDRAYAFQVSQKFPWSGKRALRGEAVKAQAKAASFDVPDAQLRLTEAARLAYLDYYLASRLIALNNENIRVVREFREAAEVKYQANLVTQQDVLQADVELATLTKRRVELERARRVAIARINTLVHRPPACALPPPADLPQPPEIPRADALRQLAIERRPELASLNAQIQEERAKLALACREFYPDVEVFGRYDTFWQEDPLRAQLGANINLPIYRDRRFAAVNEETLRLRQKRAQYQYQVDVIHNEVQSAYERVIESRQVVQLYRTKIVPAAQQNVESARAGYVAAKVDFLRLVEAQRQLIELRQQSAEAEVEWLRRIAECERAAGGPF